MTLLVILLTCSALSTLNLAVGAFRRHFVKGSRQRYLMATVQRATQWPALLANLVAAGLSARDMAFFDLAWSGASIGLWIWFYVQLRLDDDDDWFKGAGKRLKRWAESRQTNLGFAPGSA